MISGNGLDDIAGLTLVRDILAEIRREHAALDQTRIVHELVRRLITRQIEDVIAQTDRRLEALAPRSPDEVRHAGLQVGGFSAAMADADRAIKDFLYPKMYRHARISRIMGEAEGVVRDLFDRYSASPQDMPPEWAHGAEDDDRGRLRRIGDFIAGMTDRYALVEHARLFEATPDLR